MKLRETLSEFSPFVLLVLIIVSSVTSFIVFKADAQGTSSYQYTFTVNNDGFTDVEINFTSTISSGQSWVFMPKFSDRTLSVNRGQITSSQNVTTDQLPGYNEDQYFYQGFKFSYQASGYFSMTLGFGFDNGALIIEPRGIFFSPLIGFNPSSEGEAQVFFPPSFTVNQSLAAIIGSLGNYHLTVVQDHYVQSSLAENVVRIQVEFDTSSTVPDYTAVTDVDNKTFTFNSVTRYTNYAQNVMRFYDRIYGNFTNLFNVTLSDVELQWFLPDFESLLTVGGFVPITTGQRLGAININIVFVRSVNGTVEVIAAHELVHRFLGAAGISPNDFLWFHEGMAQYESISIAERLGYEGAIQQKTALDQSATQLIQLLGGEDFGFLQGWSPSSQPVDISNYYVAAYYVINRLPQIYGQDLYDNFFKLINGVSVDNIDILALYLSKAANSSVASTLQHWGFSVVDLYTSADISQRITETQKAIAAVDPVFQPYRAIAEYFYRQALTAFRQGNDANGLRLLGWATTTAQLAPLLTFLTILAILALIVLILVRRGRPRPVAAPPQPPPPVTEPQPSL